MGPNCEDQTATTNQLPVCLERVLHIEIERNGSTPTTLTVTGPSTVMFGDSPDGQAGTGIYVDQVAKGGATLGCPNPFN